MLQQNKIFSSQSGMSLIEVILGAAVIAIAAVAIPQVMKLMQHNSAQSQAIRVSVTERTKIDALLKNHAAWAQTMQKNPSFACGVNGTACSENSVNNGFYNFVLYGAEPNEKLTYDSGDATTRVTLQGAHCPAGTPDPSERCPIQFQAAWKPICATYPCINPTIQIKVSLSTKYGPAADDVIPINVEKYGHAVVRSFNEDDIQSACLVLNGTYNSVTNTCLPPHAGRNCAALGKPAQVVTGVDPSGNITCSPFYNKICDPNLEMMTGISATGAAVCSPRPVPPPAVDCVGNWGACSAACNGGTQTYAITIPASGGGAACPVANGATQACNVGPCPVNCVGSWQACTQLCGGGTSTFVVTTPAANGGSACIANHGDVVACNTQACGVPVNCSGTWSACDPVTGTETFTVTQAAQNGGTACPASPRTCKVDCVGNWGACSGSPSSKTYTWSVTPKNGGAACPYVNGATDAASCVAGGCWALDYFHDPSFPASAPYSCAKNGACSPIGSIFSSTKCNGWGPPNMADVRCIADPGTPLGQAGSCVLPLNAVPPETFYVLVNSSVQGLMGGAMNFCHDPKGPDAGTMSMVVSSSDSSIAALPAGYTATITCSEAGVPRSCTGTAWDSNHVDYVATVRNGSNMVVFTESGEAEYNCQ